MNTDALSHPPPSVEKLAAFVRSMTSRERAEVEAWLIRAERQVETAKAALRVHAAEAARDAFKCEVATFDRTWEPSGRLYPTILRIAQSLADIGRPATAKEIADGMGTYRELIHDHLNRPWFTRKLGGLNRRGRPTKLYDLSPTGLAAVTRAKQSGAACAG